MTLNNLLNPSDWEETREGRDRQLIKTFGLLEGDLTNIRSESTLIDRVLAGAAILHERLQQSDVDPLIIPAQFTLNNLALMTDDGSYSRSPPIRAVITALKRRYRRILFETRGSNLEPTRTQLLREEIGAYYGNLYQARMAWGGFSVSEYDWLKDVRIPLRIGLEEAILLGILFSRATIISRDKQERNDNRLEVLGRNCDFELYDGILHRLIRQVHNIIPSDPSDTKRSTMDSVNSGGYTYKIPYLMISSLALVTWLQEDIGMSNSKRDRRVPNCISTPEQRLGFLEGVIASTGGIYQYPDKTIMCIRSLSPEFLRELLILSESLGYTPHLGNGRLDYKKRDIATMVERGLFINPHHIRKSSGITIHSSPPVQPHLHYLSS